MFEDDAPAPAQDYRIGQTLDSLSVEEIELTIQRLKDEIARLEKTLASKAGHLQAAESLFSKK